MTEGMPIMELEEKSLLKGNILIVDDTPDNLRLLERILTRKGYTVRPVTSGNMALSSVRLRPPDLILLDIMMPDLSGYDVCKQLKADERTRDIPVIFISALQEVSEKVNAFTFGGVDYVTKPFDPHEILARVQTHLTIRNLQRQLQEQNFTLQEQNDRFRILEDATFEGIVIHDGDQILEFNRRFEEMLGYQRTELIGKNLLTLLASASREAVWTHISSGDELPCYGEIVRKDGVVLPIEMQAKAMPYQGLAVRVTAVRDLSRQRAIEAEKEQLQQENLVLKATMKERYRFGSIIGKSQVMQEVYELITSAAASRHNVVISGESGTGKELVAHTIHALSHRRTNAFIPVNCGAIVETLFEREFFGHRKGAFTGADSSQVGFFDVAHRGTLFLDELSELSAAMQVKLLRVLDLGEYTPVGDTRSKQADVRIIAATNRDLNLQLQQGKIREDFFYRVHVIEIKLPPLRDRKEDIPLLVDYFLSQDEPGQKPPRLPVKVAEMLYNYEWPGNVRELQNKLQHYLVTKRLNLPGVSQRDLLPDQQVPTSGTLPEAVEALEKTLIANALHQNRWRRGKTADMLGIPRKTLQRKMEKYGLQ
jgi:PAS domain S-box-containing protein